MFMTLAEMKLPSFAGRWTDRIRRGGAEGSVGGGDLPVGLVSPRPERVVATMTSQVLSPYSAGGAPLMTSMRLDRSPWDLVGEDLGTAGR